MKHSIKYFLIFTSFLLISCQKGFQTGASSTDGGTGGGQSVENVEKIWAMAIDKQSGQADGGQYNNQLLVRIDRVNQAIVLILPLPPIFVGGFTEFEVQDMPGVIVRPVTNEDGGRSIAVTIPLRYLHKDAQFRDVMTLPSGDKLPFMPVGEMTGFAVSFPQQPRHRIHLYVAVSAAAVFVETPDMDDNWNELLDRSPIIPRLGFPIKNRKYNSTVGWFELIMPKTGYASGVYVSSQIPAELAHLINEIIRF